MITFQDIKENKEINTYIESADQYLANIGYTEHSFKHVLKCAAVVEYILESLGYDERTIELGKIAAYMHDIGNIVNRAGHARSGAIMAFEILTKLGMDTKEIADIVSAIGNHDESSAYPVSVISSALIIADKTDVRRTRVRKEMLEFDIHNRVNYAAIKSRVIIDKEQKTLKLNLMIDTTICSIMEYFEIFLSRMKLCASATSFFGLDFKLFINDQDLI